MRNFDRISIIGDPTARLRPYRGQHVDFSIERCSFYPTPSRRRGGRTRRAGWTDRLATFFREAIAAKRWR